MSVAASDFRAGIRDEPSVEYRADTTDPLGVEGGCLVLPVFATRRLRGAAAALDETSGGRLTDALQRVGLAGERGESLLLLDVPNAKCDRVLLIGCGRRGRIDARRFVKIADHAAREIERSGAARVTSCLSAVSVERRDTRWRIAQLVEAQERRRYRFEALKSGMADAGNADANRPRRLEVLSLYVKRTEALDGARAACTEARAIAAGVRLARDLSNLSPDRCTPRTLAAVAHEIAARHGSVTATVLEEPELESLGMGALLSVARGSAEPARLIVLEHVGAEADAAPLCLVGKGITFDSGGLSLKPPPSMESMKFDMGGAAAVLGALDACAALRLPLRVVAVVAAAENMPGPEATRPGDVITTMSGRTVEVLNTDAEGRLVLCDALTWAATLKPRAVVDVATLTGACVTALGSHLHGLFSGSESLRRELARAGRYAHDRAWSLPLLEEYQSALDSEVADVRNVGGRGAGATVAACFLWRFARELRWAHLDVAGTASRDGSAGATGRPVPLLVRWLLDRVEAGADRS